MHRAALISLSLVLAAMPAAAQRVLFDASHGQTAGNADWIIDAETSELEFLDFQCRRTSRHQSGQRLPLPAQSEIALDTPETVWSGGISSWAIDLAKDALDPERGRDWTIEQYAWNAPPMTFGDPTNAQDLSNYDVLILCEPNEIFSEAEAQAIREFVASGGGLFLVADHETSDRNCSGGGIVRHDSPFILNRLMETAVETQRVPPYFDPSNPDNDYGVFGIWFYENDNDDPDDGENKSFDWFNEPVNKNVAGDPEDPIIHGPFGDGSGGLGLFASTQLAVSTDPEKGNPTARAHIWRNGQAQTTNAVGVSERATLATASFGLGRVVAIGDSSPADDGTGQGSLHPGWDKASGGVANDVLFLNATEWIANPEPDLEPPKLTAGPAATAEDCRAEINWVTDEPASSVVEWGGSSELAETAEAAGFTTGHAVTLSGLEPETQVFFRVLSLDPAGNGPTVSEIESFVTTATTWPKLVVVPNVVELGHDGAVIEWGTDKPTSRSVLLAHAGEAPEKRDGEGEGTVHRVALSGLEPETEYSFRTVNTDACGQAVESPEARFATLERPASRDISGWRLVTTNRDFVFVFPEGTEIAAGSYVVVGRNASRAEFETEWGVLPEGAVYLDSGDEIVINSTARPYELLDAGGASVDGPTVRVRSGQSWQRQDGCTEAQVTTAWKELPVGAGGPGRGTLFACAAGVVISEMTDASDFRFEFVEIYFDP